MEKVLAKLLNDFLFGLAAGLGYIVISAIIAKWF